MSHLPKVDSPSDQVVERSALRRTVYVILGVSFVGIAGIGVFLPGIPTVGPLLIASLFLTKSSPALEKRLVRNRFFAKFLPYLDGTEEMPIKAKLISIATMWTSILVSLIILTISGQGHPWLLGTIVIAGLVGTIFILRFGKKNDLETP